MKNQKFEECTIGEMISNLQEYIEKYPESINYHVLVRAHLGAHTVGMQVDGGSICEMKKEDGTSFCCLYLDATPTHSL